MPQVRRFCQIRDARTKGFEDIAVDVEKRYEITEEGMQAKIDELKPKTKKRSYDHGL